MKKSHIFGKLARRILEATLGKSVILPRFITLFGCSVMLPAATHDEREAVSSCISSFCLGKNISLLRGRYARIL